MRDLFIAAYFTVVAIMIACCFLVAGCSFPKHSFSHGDIVYSKLDGRKGMVVVVYHFSQPLRYEVKFSGLTLTTQTRLISDDAPVLMAPYATITMREYELVGSLEEL